MGSNGEISVFLRFYPQIYFACHRRHLHDKKTRGTLSLNQVSILDHLDGIEPTHLHSLAKHMGVTASTMSLNVDRLEQAGYLSRKRDDQDARRIELRLTEKGTRMKQQQTVLDPELVGTLLKRLKVPARARALHGLELLAEEAAKMISDQQTDKAPSSVRHGKRRRDLP